MNDSKRVTRRAWPAARTAVAGAALILLGGCGGTAATPGGTAATPGSTAAAAGGSRSTGAADSPLLAFARCMRSRDISGFPDPQPGDSGAKFPGAQQLGVSAARYQAAQSACQHLLPAGIDDEFPVAEVPLLLSGMRQFSQCMRAHGVPDWPDPVTDSRGRPVFDPGADGITRAETQTPQFQAKMAACQPLLPSSLGGLPIGGP